MRKDFEPVEVQRLGLHQRSQRAWSDGRMSSIGLMPSECFLTARGRWCKAHLSCLPCVSIHNCAPFPLSAIITCQWKVIIIFRFDDQTVHKKLLLLLPFLIIFSSHTNYYYYFFFSIIIIIIIIVIIIIVVVVIIILQPLFLKYFIIKLRMVTSSDMRPYHNPSLSQSHLITVELNHQRQTLYYSELSKKAVCHQDYSRFEVLGFKTWLGNLSLTVQLAKFNSQRSTIVSWTFASSRTECKYLENMKSITRVFWTEW